MVYTLRCASQDPRNSGLYPVMPPRTRRGLETALNPAQRVPNPTVKREWRGTPEGEVYPRERFTLGEVHPREKFTLGEVTLRRGTP